MIMPGDMVIANDDITVRAVRETTPRCSLCNKFCKTLYVSSQRLSSCCQQPLITTLNCKTSNIIGVCVRSVFNGEPNTVDVMMNGAATIIPDGHTIFYEPGMICKFSL